MKLGTAGLNPTKDKLMCTTAEQVAYYQAPPDPMQIALCEQWIGENCKMLKRISQKWSSYGLKHVVERWCTDNGGREYISNGSFIQAAINLGYKIGAEHGLNCCFNIKVLRLPSRYIA